MEFQDVIDSCRTIHSFTEQRVAKEIILEGLEESLKAPNHKFTFPWKYYFVGEQKQEQIYEWFLKQKFGDNPSEEQKAALAVKIKNPTMILFAQKHNDDPFFAKEDYATMACSVQLLALYLANKRIGYKWSTAPFTSNPFTYKLLGIDADKEEIVGAILIGHAKAPPKERKRPPLNDILVHCE